MREPRNRRPSSGMSTNSTTTGSSAAINPSRSAENDTDDHSIGPAIPWSRGRSLERRYQTGASRQSRTQREEFRVARFLDRLGRTAARHHWWFIGAWLRRSRRLRSSSRSPSTARPTTPSRSPGTQSQQALDLLEVATSRARPARPRRSCSTRRRASTTRTVQSAIQASIANLAEAAARRERRQSDPAPKATRAPARSRSSPCSTTPQAQDVGLDAYDLAASRPPRPREGAGINLAYGGAVVDYAEPPAVGRRRPHRAPRRGDHPAVRVRVGRRDGPPDPDRAVRSRRRCRADQRRRRVHRRSARSRRRSAR